MLDKGKAIVLSSLKYKDSDLIVRCYTSNRGIISYLQKGILKSKKSKTRAVHFQPLMLLEIDEAFKAKRSLQYLREVKCYYPYKTLHTNVFKASLAVFIAEVLSTSLKEEEPNHDLFEFLETSFQLLDLSTSFANFHLIFLLKLTKYLGFYPDDNNTELPYFNLESGIFEREKTSMYLVQGLNKELLVKLMNQDLSSLENLKLKSNQRSEFLQVLLLYFELHLGNFKKPKSLQVFTEVFH